MKKLYGNLTNRLMENQNFTNREIREGDDLTMYLYSDRRCYFVTKVINQNHIFIHPYHVCADQSKPGGMGHQNWLYFKTAKQHNEYLNKYFPDSYDENPNECPDTELMLRRGKWKIVTRCGPDDTQYSDPDGNISFGVRDYYYDWEF